MTSARELFDQGHDTLAISEILGIGEDEALKQLSKERSASLHLPDPYSMRVRNLSVRPQVLRVTAKEIFVRPRDQHPDWLFGLVTGGAA